MVQEPLQWKYIYISMGVTLQDFSPPSVVRKRFFLLLTLLPAAAKSAAKADASRRLRQEQIGGMPMFSIGSSKSRCEPPIATRLT